MNESTEVPVDGNKDKRPRAALKTTLEVLSFGFQLKFAKSEYREMLVIDGLPEESVEAVSSSIEARYRILFMAIGIFITSVAYLTQKIFADGTRNIPLAILMYTGIWIFLIQLINNKQIISSDDFLANISIFNRDKK